MKIVYSGRTKMIAAESGDKEVILGTPPRVKDSLTVAISGSPWQSISGSFSSFHPPLSLCT